MPLFLSHVAVKIRGLCSVYIVYGAKHQPEDKPEHAAPYFVRHIATLRGNHTDFLCDVRS